MKSEIILSQTKIPVNSKAQVNFLLKLHPESFKQQAKNPVDLRFLLDRSGSMDDRCADGNTKLEVLKKSLEELIDILKSNQDSIYIVAFDDNVMEVVPKQIVKNHTELKQKVTALVSGGSTKMSDALELGVMAKKMDAHNVLTKIIIFTDGQVNVGNVAAEERRCHELADEGRKRGISFSVFATGIDYNEMFLRKMAEFGGGGSYFMHVGQVGQVRAQLQDEIDLLRSIEDQNIDVEFIADDAVVLLDVLKTIPQQVDLKVDQKKIVKDSFPGLDVRGQSYLLKLEVPPAPEGNFQLGVVKLAWVDTAGRKLTDELRVVVERTGDATQVSKLNPTVLKTVYNSAAVRATTMNNIDLATKLFKTAGNDKMVTQLETLGTAAKTGNEEAGRTLRTIVTTSAHKDDDSETD